MSKSQDFWEWLVERDARRDAASSSSVTSFLSSDLVVGRKIEAWLKEY